MGRKGKRLAVLLAASAVSAVFAASLAACSPAAVSESGAKKEARAQTEAAETEAVNASDAVTLKMATGGTTGTYYDYGVEIAALLNQKLDGIQLTVLSSGASKANILLLNKGRADVAIAQNDVLDYAVRGTELFEEDGAVDGFSAATALYGEVCQIVASDEIPSIKSLKGRRISVGDAGSGVEFNARQILEAYGLSFDDVEVSNLGFGDSAEALKSGRIDAFFCTAGAPTTALTRLATENPLHLLEIDGEHAALLQERYPFYTRYTIPSGTYMGVNDSVETVAVKATLIVSDRLEEETVYELVKGLYDNKTELTSRHVKGAELSPSYGVDGVSIELHPGAERYFREAGVLP